jgi:hypothetical protein
MKTPLPHGVSPSCADSGRIWGRKSGSGPDWSRADFYPFRRVRWTSRYAPPRMPARTVSRSSVVR